jgi:hypothetical protein
VKESTREFIEEQWTTLGPVEKAKNIFKQFRVPKNPYNKKLKDQPTFIMKTRRV